MTPELFFSAVGEAELNELLEGEFTSTAFPWHGRHGLTRIQGGSFGILSRKPNHRSDFLQPLLLVAREDEFRRLFGRLSQVRSDLSPLTTWCHLMTPNRFEILDQATRGCDLGGMDAAWAALIVAEALLLSERPISKIKIAACLATQSFTVARASALWGLSARDILDRFDNAQQLLRASESQTTRLRAALEPIWSSLIAASSLNMVSDKSPLVSALRALFNARETKSPDEAFQFSIPLRPLAPEAEVLARLPQLTPEQRVREFDKVMSRLNDAASNDNAVVHQALSMVAGYLATIAAGGSPSLSLLETHTRRWPEIAAWAYVLGSLGERVVWTSSFDGLGRLVARELSRPLRLDEPPTCDFALDEAIVLHDPKLPDPLVHLRIKQARIVTVGLISGVNVLIPLADQSDERRDESVSSNQRGVEHLDSRMNTETLDVVADAVWRRLRGRIETFVESVNRNANSRNLERRPGKRTSSQSKLPLKEPNER